MPTLNAQELSELESIKSVSLENFSVSDAVAYYEYLENQGFSYGTLALGVVEDDTARGRIANAYAASVADVNGIDFTVGSAAWKEMQWQLMQQDYSQRFDNNGADLSWQQYNNSHVAALQAVGLPPETWTAHIPLSQIAESDPVVAAAVWEDLVTDDGFFDSWLSEGFYTIGLGSNINAQQSLPDIMADYAAQMEWYGHMAKALAGASVDFVEDLFDPQVHTQFWSDLNAFKDFLGDLAPGGGAVPAPWLGGIPDHPDPASPLPSPVGGALGPWGQAPNTGSPLILDLAGTGIALTAYSATTTETFFDIDGDGFAEQTAWTGANMGFLARDLNDNDRIDDVTELFGSPSIDGFALLATLDSNGDHLIDQYDSDWSDLIVWVDANGDAMTQDGELHTLGSLDIVSIDLAGVASSTSTISGNAISHTSTYKLDNGTTRSIVDAWFTHSNVNTTYVEDYTLDIRTLYLPTLRGFGEIASLHIAMSENEDLLDLVQQFVLDWDISRFEDNAALNSDVQDILWAWAGVEDVPSTSRGAYIDARKLAFLEQFFGNEFLQLGQYANPAPNAAALLNETWERLFYAMKAQLIVQVGGADIYDGTIAYNAWSGEFEGDMDLSQNAMDDIDAAAPANSGEATEYWKAVAEFLAFTKGFTSLETSENTMVSDAIDNTSSGYDWTEIQYMAVPGWVGVTNPGSPDDDVINGTNGSDTLDGGAGDDEIYANEGNDLIYGGSGNDLINGGGHDDTIYGGSGNDEIHTGTGTNTAYGEDGDDELNGYTGVDTLDGGNGNDVLWGKDGNDVLKPGTGGNTVHGGYGNDTYWYQLGTDVYSEYGQSGTDTILMPSGFDAGDITFYRKASDATNFYSMLLVIDGAGTIELERMFSSSSGLNQSSSIIESITFADTTTLDLTGFTTLTTYGTEANDYFFGIQTSQTISNTLYGYEGNDTLRGRGGDDILDGGVGNDILQGDAGNDTYIASPGFDEITDGYSGTDKILIPDGYDLSDVSFLRLSTNPNDLKITIDGLGQIIVKSQFYGTGTGSIETLDFNGASTFNLLTAQIETIGTPGNDNISRITVGGSTNDIMDGREGNDTLQGLEGDDTYYFSLGTDTISENGGNDTIAFRDAWSPEDITIYRTVGTYSTTLVLEDQNGNKMQVGQHFTSDSSGNYAAYSVEQIVFADSTTWTLANMEIEARGTAAADYLYGAIAGDASSDDTIYGYGGNDQISGGAGNDVIYGGDGDDNLSGQAGDDWLYGGAGNDYLSGGASNDTYVWTVGEGNDTIYDDGGTDTLHVTGGFTVNDVTLTDYSSYHTQLTISGQSGNLTINHLRSASAGYRVDKILFDDGFTTSLPDYNSWTKGTAGNDNLTGTGSDETIIGLAGNDTLDGAGGADDIHGGAGDDTLYGDTGADQLHGGIGDDTLYGEDGLDTLFGGDGADVFVFETATAFSNVDVIKDFSLGDEDAIDLSDILTGFDPMSDAITDFIQITTSGSNSSLFVDRDGTGGTYGMQQIATIEGVTGLTDETALYNGGYLIAA